MVEGILNVNKPRGMTSFAVVSLVRRLTGVRRVGHAGTLDPIADGVLPICIGRHATRIVEYLVDARKAYRAVIRLGVATDTYDSEGEVVATGDPSGVTRAQLETALRPFVGEIQQVPPIYSALKYQGQPLYRYARAGKTVPLKARTVAIYRLELLNFESPLVEIELECGRGAYVRSLAYDLGERLGCGGHLEGLTRLRSGPFLLKDAIGVEELEEVARHDAWQEVLSGVDRVLESWDAALLGQEHTIDVRQGRSLVLTPARPEAAEVAPDALCRAYSEAGIFLGILRYRGEGRWRPEKVFAAL
ncbi:MAG: tRNA pseudouridine(55) synthase TruB [Chloroflexi bacterium]|nr:tRNA pseudouridine(55) synthase TruB [Chloroflexota bacterium]